MRISHFFIDRPIFAAVISIIIVILGAVSFGRLPVAQYPEIAPPIINISGQYPGASADVVAATVVAPIEQQINGVENMLYISSNSTGDGRFAIAVTFDLGTNLDTAQVQVQNRVAIAQPRLPSDVRNIGVTVTKSSPDLMLVVHLFSPDQSRDTLFISNYANIQVNDVLSRVDGVGSITVFGSRDYSMRIWLDPARLQSLGLTAGDVINALQAKNVQVASGVLNQPPVDRPRAFQVAVQTLGRLVDPQEFGNIVVKQSVNAVIRVKDVARVELAALDYTSNSYLDRDPAVGLGIFQRPGSNALATAQAIRATMDELAKSFPSGLRYTIVYNPTQFIQQSVDAVLHTIGEAVILVVLVVILFLQTWRAAVIPIVAIPISLIGTFFVMAMFGFSLNNLSLFGLVLAIGIVVDDAIDAGDRVGHFQSGVVGDEQRVARLVGRVEVHDHHQVRRGLLHGDADIAHVRRQARIGDGDAVLHLHLGDVEIGAELEADRDREAAVGGRVRGDIDHVLDAVDLLLDRRHHSGGDDLGAGARILAGDADQRRRNLGILRDRQAQKRHGAQDRDDHRDHRGKDRPVDEEMRDAHLGLRLQYCD